jgi:hypothetical protein
MAVAACVSLAGCESRNTGSSDGAPESAAAKENGTSQQPADAPADADDGPLGASSSEKAKSKQDEKSASDVAAAGDDEAKKVPPGVDPLLIGKPRPDTAGWWRIVFSVPSRQDFPNDYSAGFVKIGKAADGTYRVEEVRTNFIVDPAKVVKSEATDKTVRLFFEHNDLKFDYEGTLEGGIIRGTLQFNSPRQNLVRLTPVTEAVATDDDVLEKAQLGTTFGSEELYGVIRGDDRVEKLEELAKTWNKSPVLFHVNDLLLQNSAEFGFDRPQIERLIKGFEGAATPWGDRAIEAAKLSAAADLLLSGTETSIADAKIEEVHKDAPQLLESWQELLDGLRKRGEKAKAQRERVAALDAAAKQVESKDAAEVQKGIATLRELHAKKPSDPLATYRLAAALQSQGADDEALDLFARLAVLPQTELELGEVAAEASYRPARVVAARLYEKAHGSRDGFDAFLRKTYKQALTSFLTDQDRDRKQTESARVTLVEMFTGAECPPCVAADVATDAIEQSFPQADVAVLRYHVHVPGPDPLSSADSLARKDYYAAEVAGTPTILIDGQLVEYNVGGAYSNAPEIYEELASTVSEAAAQPPEGSIELKASAADEKLSIDVTASAPEKPADSVRLRSVIAESEIDYSASNGIKEHEMVVREMPGGAAGIAAVQGQFAFQQEIPLVELRDRLNTGLTTAEQQLSLEYGQKVWFRTRPLDLRRLTIVAFLQDDTTREVLQTAVVPIENEIELPPLETTSAADAPKPAGEENGDDQPAPPEPSDKSNEPAAAGPDLKSPE